MVVNKGKPDKDEYGKDLELIKYKPSNISKIRELAGLKQVELAKLTGLAQAYLSEIESTKKGLTKEAAEKIALALDRLINDPGQTVYKIDEVLLWAGHVASSLPVETQTRIIDLFLEISRNQKELHYILQHKEIPSDSYLKNKITDENIQIASLIKKRRAAILSNKELLIGDQAPDIIGSTIGYMPRF